MDNKLFYAVFLISLFFLTSCALDSGSSQDSNSNWRTGTEGIRMGFVPDNPPGEVVSSQEFNVMVEYSNKGANPVNDLRFYVTGYDSSILFGSQVQSSSAISLIGKDLYSPGGSQSEYLTWKTSVRTPSKVDSFKQDITVTSCYSYKTIATPNICIDPQRYDVVASSKCKFSIEGLGSSQGGPMAVTDVKQKNTGSKVYLEIHFENKGSGTPFAGRPVENCYNSLGLADVDTIGGIFVTMSGRTFTCNPTGRIRLTNGRGYVICEAPISTNNYFMSPLNIELSYNYRQAMTKTITIVNVAR